MIIPVREDGLDNSTFDPGFLLYSKGCSYWIEYCWGPTGTERIWKRRACVSLDRRSPNLKDVGDGVADMVVNILMSEDQLGGLTILEYFSTMGLDVCSGTLWSRFKRWIAGKK